MTRVLIVDDHQLFREGLRLLLAEFGMVVVGEAADGLQALAEVERELPDIVLMDISMPGMSGLTAAARLAQIHPAIRVVVLSMHTDERYVRMALDAGARGYLLKDAGREELLDALHQVTNGGIYIGHGLQAPAQGGAADGALGLERLTVRQRQILQLLAEGHSVKDIGSRLDISPKTVETHRSQLMDRLGIEDIPGLVRFAIRVGLILAEP